MQTKVLRASDYPRAAWKNGLGFTDQIAIHPPTADLRRGDFIWRVSSARIERGSPFSPFPEHDRVLVVLSGGGLKLTHRFDEESDPEVLDVGVMEPYEFPGDVPTSCELLDGPVVDLSLFFAKGLDAQVETMRIESGESYAWSSYATTRLAFLVKGRLEVQGQSLERSDSLVVRGATEESFELRAGPEGAELVLIQLGGV